MENDGLPDLLSGYAEIGEYLGVGERHAKNLAEARAIPTFKLPGSRIVRARRSTLRNYLRDQEAAALASKPSP